MPSRRRWRDPPDRCPPHSATFRGTCPDHEDKRRFSGKQISPIHGKHPCVPGHQAPASTLDRRPPSDGDARAEARRMDVVRAQALAIDTRSKHRMSTRASKDEALTAPAAPSRASTSDGQESIRALTPGAGGAPGAAGGAPRGLPGAPKGPNVPTPALPKG